MIIFFIFLVSNFLSIPPVSFNLLIYNSVNVFKLQQKVVLEVRKREKTRAVSENQLFGGLYKNLHSFYLIHPMILFLSYREKNGGSERFILFPEVLQLVIGRAHIKSKFA